MPQQFRMDIPTDELKGVLDDLKLEPQFKIVSKDDRGGIVVLIVEDTSAPDPVVAPDPGPTTAETGTTAPGTGTTTPGTGTTPPASGTTVPGTGTTSPGTGTTAPGTGTTPPASGTTTPGGGTTTPGTGTGPPPPPPPPPPAGGLQAKAGKNQAVVNALIAGANKHGLDPMMVLTIIAIESMYNPTICNRFSSAAGLFQFIDKTWAKESGGMKFPGRGGNGKGQAAGASIGVQVEIGCKFTKANAASLRAQLGSEPTATRIYMAHQQGLGGALQILKAAQKNPNAPITSVISADAARLNGFGGMTVAQTVAKFDVLVKKKALVARDQVV